MAKGLKESPDQFVANVARLENIIKEFEPFSKYGNAVKSFKKSIRTIKSKLKKLENKNG